MTDDPHAMAVSAHTISHEKQSSKHFQSLCFPAAQDATTADQEKLRRAVGVKSTEAAFATNGSLKAITAR